MQLFPVSLSLPTQQRNKKIKAKLISYSGRAPKHLVQPLQYMVPVTVHSKNPSEARTEANATLEEAKTAQAVPSNQCQPSRLVPVGSIDPSSFDGNVLRALEAKIP